MLSNQDSRDVNPETLSDCDRHATTARNDRERALSEALAEALPPWARRAIGDAGGYQIMPDTYGHGGMLRSTLDAFERELDLRGYRIVPKLSVVGGASV